jgi:hypothetical protein
LNQDSTLIVVIEMSQSSSLVAGMVPGVECQPLKKLKTEEDQLLRLLFEGNPVPMWLFDPKTMKFLAGARAGRACGW